MCRYSSISNIHGALSFPATMATESDKWQKCGNAQVVCEAEWQSKLFVIENQITVSVNRLAGLRSLYNAIVNTSNIKIAGQLNETLLLKYNLPY